MDPWNDYELNWRWTPNVRPYDPPSPPPAPRLRYVLLGDMCVVGPFNTKQAARDYARQKGVSARIQAMLSPED